MRDFIPAHRSIARGVVPEEALSRFTGCMTSMLLGKGCMSRYARTPEHVAQVIYIHIYTYIYIYNFGGVFAFPRR